MNSRRAPTLIAHVKPDSEITTKSDKYVLLILRVLWTALETRANSELCQTHINFNWPHGQEK